MGLSPVIFSPGEVVRMVWSWFEAVGWTSISLPGGLRLVGDVGASFAGVLRSETRRAGWAIRVVWPEKELARM